MAEGWIKDYRKELDSDIWVMPPLYYKVWQYLKYKANHKPKEIPMADGTKEIIGRGQHLTSYRALARGVAYYEGAIYREPNPKCMKKIIQWLEKNNMITVSNGRGNRQYTKITIVNYDVYQGEDYEGVTENTHKSNSKETPSTHQGNSKETLGKQLVDINKNDKELYKNDIRMIENEEEGKEGEETPSSPPLSYSFPTQYHKSIFSEVSEVTYKTWFMNTRIVEEGDLLGIEVENDFTKDVIVKRHLDTLKMIFNKEIIVQVKEE